MSVSGLIKIISAQETLPLRQKVLKPFLSLQECINPGDEFETTFHLGYLQIDQVISIATFLAENHPEIKGHKSYRLRGMATLPEFQNKQIGQKLLEYGINLLIENQSELLWCNAREKAFSFYTKLGFTPSGPLFEMKDIGPHKVMYKRLNPR